MLLQKKWIPQLYLDGMGRCGRLKRGYSIQCMHTTSLFEKPMSSVKVASIGRCQRAYGGTNSSSMKRFGLAWTYQ